MQLPSVFDSQIHESVPRSYIPGKVSAVCPAPEQQFARVLWPEFFPLKQKYLTTH